MSIGSPRSQLHLDSCYGDFRGCCQDLVDLQTGGRSCGSLSGHSLSKFHEDKRAIAGAIAKARGEEISEYTEWMRAMVEQALLVAKQALEEDDFLFPTGNADRCFRARRCGAAWLEHTMAKGRPRWRRHHIWIRTLLHCAPGLGQGKARIDALSEGPCTAPEGLC